MITMVEYLLGISGKCLFAKRFRWRNTSFFYLIRFSSKLVALLISKLPGKFVLNSWIS